MEENTKIIPNINSNIDKEIIVENEIKKRSKSKENSIRNRLRKNPQKIKTVYSNDELISNDQTKSIPEKEYTVCKFILDKIKKHEKSSSFRQPAVRCFQNQKDKDLYKSIIVHPQDLGHITKKLNSKKYLSLQEFYDDLTLIWDNAQTFNPKNTLTYRDSLYMSKYMDKLFKDKDLYNKLEHKTKKRNKKNENGKEEEINNDNKIFNNNKTFSGRKRKRKIRYENCKNDRTPLIKSNIYVNNNENNHSYEEDKKIDSLIESNEKPIYSQNNTNCIKKRPFYGNQYTKRMNVKNNRINNYNEDKNDGSYNDNDIKNNMNNNNLYAQYNNKNNDFIQNFNQTYGNLNYNYNIEKSNIY